MTPDIIAALEAWKDDREVWPRTPPEEAFEAGWNAALSTSPAGQEVRSSAEFHQRRGMMADAILAALHEYDEWMKDDDYNAQGCLDRVVAQLHRVRDVAALSSVEPAGNGREALDALKYADTVLAQVFK